MEGQRPWRNRTLASPLHRSMIAPPSSTADATIRTLAAPVRLDRNTPFSRTLPSYFLLRALLANAQA